MKVTVARTAGFCMGVRRAVEMVLDTANRASGPVYTFGPLIHNPQVMDILAEKGVRVLDRIPGQGRGTVVIRAHGITPEVKENLAAAGFEVQDATCPRVIKVQTLLKKHVDKGHQAIIVGDADHPEVIGLLGHARGRGAVVKTPEEVDGLEFDGPVCVVAQTTQDAALFEAICERVRARYPDAAIFNTICDSTSRRQAETAELARSMDAMVVVGGKNSGNTRRLFEIAQRSGVPSWHIETEDELDTGALAGLEQVGVTAGASTPTWIIRRVRQAMDEPGNARTRLRRRLLSVMRSLILTNAFIALGAASMTAAASTLLGGPPSLSLMVMAAAYVLSIHTFNNFIGQNAIRYNDPDRAWFYTKYRVALLTVAAAGLGAALLTALRLGALPFLILAFIAVMGLLYNVPIFPARHPLTRKYPRIRAIPGSKTFSVALAWGVVTGLLPALAHKVPFFSMGWLVVFFWAGGTVFLRSATFDMLDVQIDRIAGQETVATWLGADRTVRVLRRLLAGLFILLVASATLGWISAWGFLLTGCVALPAGVLYGHTRGLLHPGYRLEFLVDTNFILSGLLTAGLAWIFG